MPIYTHREPISDVIQIAADRTARYLLTSAPFLKTYMLTQMASAGIARTQESYDAFFDAVLASLVAQRTSERRVRNARGGRA